ncbi:Subtilisin-like protease 3 [Colletotrichum trifolii]|uniref:Subtilisin-like protease 3 n=1 Tax=Colletotrichum trifolii TaxID=5466 RepID=A0A4V6QEY1_COLTR|nr:Subtilisin-like protease 3 [Colletotrichum trifolii]
MQGHQLLGLLAAFSFSSGTAAHPHPYQKDWDDYTHKQRHLLARQQPLYNDTRPRTSTQHVITSAPTPSISVSKTLTTSWPSSSAPATSTISNGEVVLAIIGATYIAGIGGAILMVGGTPHALAAGAMVTIIGGGPNGDTPEVETVSSPNRSQSPQTSDQASRPTTSAPVSITSSTTPTSSASPTSSSAASSSAAAPTPYIVLFAQDATADKIEAVNNTLNKVAAPDSLSEVTSDRTGLVVFFKAAISPAQADDIGQEPGVSGVFPRVPPARPRLIVPNPTDVKLQYDAVDELKAISQPAGAALADLPGYGYASEGGKGVIIYVMDTGEWASMPGTKSFMYAPGAVRAETDGSNHGSCVASKAGGPVYGTAKDADMIAVKLPEDLSTSAIFTALIEISNDVYEKGREGKAVINMSLGSRMADSTATAYKLLLVALMAQDIVIVTASGNDAQFGIDDVTGYPALFGPSTDIIVVGAVDEKGYRSFFSQGTESQLTVSAPGFVECANGRSAGSQELYGTSFAAPAVAGMIAVWLSQDEHKERLQVSGQVAANVKKMVQELAYPRVEGEPAVVWNGIDPRGLACPARANGNGKRQANPSGGSGGCQATSVASVSSTTMTTRPPVSTTAPPSRPPPAVTSASPPPPPPLKTLFSLDQSVSGGTKSCFPTSGFTTSAGTTYGFSFDVDPSLLVSIETGKTDEGYHQSMGSWTGTFYADSGSSLSICGKSSGGDLPLKFAITEAPSEAVEAPVGRQVLKMDENLGAGQTACFPTTGLDIQEGNYGFSYTTSDGIVIDIGDDSSGPKYFSGNKASGAGLMYIDFSGGTISVCATNSGGEAAALSLTMTQ